MESFDNIADVFQLTYFVGVWYYGPQDKPKPVLGKCTAVSEELRSCTVIK